MRKICTEDIFGAVRIIKAVGLRDKIKEVALKISKGEKITVTQEDAGAEFIFTMIDGFSETSNEKLLYKWLAGPLEMEEEEIGKMDFLTLVEEIKKMIAYQDKGAWQGFFTSLSLMIQKS